MNYMVFISYLFCFFIIVIEFLLSLLFFITFPFHILVYLLSVSLFIVIYCVWYSTFCAKKAKPKEVCYVCKVWCSLDTLTHLQHT